MAKLEVNNVIKDEKGNNFRIIGFATREEDLKTLVIFNAKLKENKEYLKVNFCILEEEFLTLTKTKNEKLTKYINGLIENVNLKPNDVYIHYKGNKYIITSIVVDYLTEVPMVSYTRYMNVEDTRIWVRTIKDFCSTVTLEDGKEVNRFTKKNI